jgi:uncharacterized protein (TIGR02246 family)
MASRYRSGVTVDEPSAVVHSILEALQAAAETHEADAFLDLLTEDAVLVGTAAANLDRPAVETYLQAVAGADGTVRWRFDTVQVVDARPDAVTFVAVGTVGWDGGEEPNRFRLTGLIVREAVRWRLRLFHGSVPQE